MWKDDSRRRRRMRGAVSEAGAGSAAKARRAKASVRPPPLALSFLSGRSPKAHRNLSPFRRMRESLSLCFSRPLGVFFETVFQASE